MKKVLFQWVNNDWIRIYIDEYHDGVFGGRTLWYEGHDLPEFKALELLQHLGIEVEEEDIEEDCGCDPECPCRD